jgi:hypothetical protein
VRGNTALDLDRHGKITRLTTIYDSFQLVDSKYQLLVFTGLFYRFTDAVTVEQ